MKVMSDANPGRGGSTETLIASVQSLALGLRISVNQIFLVSDLWP